MALLASFDVFGVVVGYLGIARLQALHFPPFREGLYMLLVAFWPPPNWLILSWDSLWGRIIMWSGCLTIPLAAFALSHVRRRHVAAFWLMIGWTLVSGVTGFWIMFDAIINAWEM